MKLNKRTQGFTLVEIMIVILIVAMLMTIAVPNFITARASSRKSSCVANLKHIDSRKEQYAMDARLDNGAAVTWADLVPTYLKAQPACPGGGAYTIAAIGTNPTCSLGAGGHLIP